MEAQPENQEYYNLDDIYRMTPYTGQNCSMIMRDNEDKVKAVVNVCNSKISNVGGFNGERVAERSRRSLIKFIKKHNYALTLSAARDLGLTIYRPANGHESYLDAKELSKTLEGDISNITLTVHNYKKRTVRIKSYTKGAVLNLSRASIKKLIIEKNCNMVVDLGDNPFIETLIVKDGFAGSINLSRNGIKKIRIADNCRCDLQISDSMKCFDLMINDVFSGSLNIKNSCFHELDIGYYSYAAINLEANWGKRNIKIGNSFRGSMVVDSVHVPNIKIGSDCKGRIMVTTKDEVHGLQNIIVDDEFNGDIDMSNSQTVSRLELGHHARGKINMLGCPSLRVARIGEHFNGTADFSESSLEYLRAGKDCRGDIILLNCDNLALLKLPNEPQPKVVIEKEPLSVRTEKNDIYYQYDRKELPAEYFTPFYAGWYNNVKKFFSEKLSN